MTRQIGTALVDAIEEINLSSAIETDEIDLVDKNNNIVLSGADEAENIEISFTLINGRVNDIESLEDNVRDLVFNSTKDNYFEFNDLEGRISVENVSLPKSSDSRNLIDGTVEGKYLPYPKHFPDESGFFLLPLGSIQGEYNQKGIISILRRIEGGIDGSLSNEAKLNIRKILRANLKGNFSKEGTLSNIVSMEGNINSSMDINGDLIDGGYGTEYGSSYGNPETTEYSDNEYSDGYYGI